MPYPTFLAGQRLTADLLTKSQPLFAYKDGDTTIISDSTLNDDPDLFLTVEALAVYRLTAYFKVLGGTTGDIKFQFNTPSADGSGSWGSHGLSVASTSESTIGTTAVRSQRFTMDSSGSFGTVSSATGQAMDVSGILRTSSAGTFQLSWAQDTSTATDTVLQSDSWIELLRVA